MKPGQANHRKLRSLGAVVNDRAATDHERANAKALKARLEKKLRAEGIPNGDWTDAAFRLGRIVQRTKAETAPPPSISGASKIAFRAGRAFGKGLKKWRST